MLRNVWNQVREPRTALTILLPGTIWRHKQFTYTTLSTGFDTLQERTRNFFTGKFHQLRFVIKQVDSGWRTVLVEPNYRLNFCWKMWLLWCQCLHSFSSRCSTN